MTDTTTPADEREAFLTWWHERYAAPPDKIVWEAWQARAASQPAQEPDPDKVICPNCCHQFRAIPVSVQQILLNLGCEPPFMGTPEPAQEPPVEWTDAHKKWCSLRNPEYTGECDCYEPAQEPVIRRTDERFVSDFNSEYGASQPAREMTADEATENAAIVILTHVLGADILDEFWAWYKPGQWIGIHRAVAAFIITKSQVAQEPFAWVIPGKDNARPDGSLDAMAWQDGEFSMPLYAAPPSDTARQDRIMELADEYARFGAWTGGKPVLDDEHRAALEREVRKPA